MEAKNKKWLVSAVLAALAALGIGGAALAQGGTKQPTTPAQQGTVASTTATTVAESGTEAASEVPDATEGPETVGGDNGDQSPSYKASITVPNADGGTEVADSEAADAQALSGLAKISADQAKAAALAAVPGTVVKVTLDNENGAVVYSVEVDTGHGVIDVKVDAGNGAILHQEAGDGSETEGAD